jgi:hypothetical protein
MGMKYITTLFSFIFATSILSTTASEQPTQTNWTSKIIEKCKKNSSDEKKINDCFIKEYAQIIAILKARKDSVLAVNPAQNSEKTMDEVRILFLPPM